MTILEVQVQKWIAEIAERRMSTMTPAQMFEEACAWAAEDDARRAAERA